MVETSGTDPHEVPKIMRAAQLVGPRSVCIREVEVPEPGPEEVLIRMEGCGLCGSNLPVWQGRPWFSYPLPPGAPGHEGWGTVVAVGSEVARRGPQTVHGVQVGDRVAALTSNAFAEYDVARHDAVVRLPRSLAGTDMPGEPIGCAINVMRRSDIREDHTVAIVGVGFLGALLIQLAREAGASVIAISQRPFSLRLARALGAEEVFELGDDDHALVRRIEELTGGEGCDRVIEAAGVQRALDLSSRLTRTRGKLVIAGYHQDGLRQVDMQAWNWRGIDVINAHERDPRVYVEGIRAAVSAVAMGTLDLSRVLTHRLPIDQIGEAFHLLESRPEGFVKAEVLT